LTTYPGPISPYVPVLAKEPYLLAVDGDAAAVTEWLSQPEAGIFRDREMTLLKLYSGLSPRDLDTIIDVLSSQKRRVIPAPLPIRHVNDRDGGIQKVFTDEQRKEIVARIVRRNPQIDRVLYIRNIRDGAGILDMLFSKLTHAFNEARPYQWNDKEFDIAVLALLICALMGEDFLKCTDIVSNGVYVHFSRGDDVQDFYKFSLILNNKALVRVMIPHPVLVPRARRNPAFRSLLGSIYRVQNATALDIYSIYEYVQGAHLDEHNAHIMTRLQDDPDYQQAYIRDIGALARGRAWFIGEKIDSDDLLIDPTGHLTLIDVEDYATIERLSGSGVNMESYLRAVYNEDVKKLRALAEWRDPERRQEILSLFGLGFQTADQRFKSTVGTNSALLKTLIADPLRARVAIDRYKEWAERDPGVLLDNIMHVIEQNDGRALFIPAIKGVAVKFDNAASVSTTERISAAGYDVYFSRLEAFDVLRLDARAVNYVKVLRGCLINPDRGVVSAERKRSLLVEQDIVRAGGSGAVIAVFVDRGNVPVMITGVTDAVMRAPNGLYFTWEHISKMFPGNEELAGKDIYYSRPQILVDGYRINFWYAGPFVNCGIHNHAADEVPFFEIHMNMVGTNGGMISYDLFGRRETKRLLLQPGEEHGAFWTVTGAGNPVYGWHAWQSGLDGNVWAVFEDIRINASTGNNGQLEAGFPASANPKYISQNFKARESGPEIRISALVDSKAHISNIHTTGSTKLNEQEKAILRMALCAGIKRPSITQWLRDNVEGFMELTFKISFAYQRLAVSKKDMELNRILLRGPPDLQALFSDIILPHELDHAVLGLDDAQALLNTLTDLQRMPWHARILIKFDREGVIDLDEDLKTALRRMFPDSRDGGIEEELETIISSPSGKTPLANRIAVCEQLVSGWEGLMNKGDLTPSDVTVIQVATTRLASLTPFDQDVNSVDASMLVALYQKIVELSLRTYIRVKDMRSGEPRENKMFQLKAAKFIYMARYGCLYQHLVQLADAIALYRGVGLSRIRAEEIPGLLRYPAAFVNRVSWIMNIFVRYAWGFEYYARKYEKEFAASIGDIKSQGNHLVPGLYMQPGSPGAQRQDVRPDILIRQKKDVDVGVRRWWNSKVALFSYILPPLGQIAILALLAQLIVYFAGIGPLPDILVYVARIGFILMIGSIAANWLALRLNDKFYKQHMSVIDAYEGQLRQLGFDEYNNRLTDEEFGKLWDIWQAEMRSDVAPSLDAVVIAASWDVALTDSVRTLLSDKDIPVMIKRTRDAGSGMALMEMIDCWKSGATVGDFIRCVAEQGGVLSLGDATPSAYTKPLSKAHVAVILAGNTLIEANKSVIPWPVDAETRLLLSPVELALLNCIRSAHVSRAQGNSKGLIIHNGDGVFVGPIEGETLAAAWKNIRDVARWQSNVIISSADGIVERIYDRARMSFIRSKYPDSFDWNNVDKKQLLVSAGIITINKDLDLFVSYLHDLHGFLSGQPALQRRFGNTGFQIRLMPDIMTIWARLNRRKDLRSDVLASYFSARIDDLDRNDPYIDEYIDLLHAWDAWNYDWFRGIPSMRVSVHRPSHNGALYFRMSNDDALNKRNLDIIQRAADELAKSLRDGGVVSHRHSFLKDQVRKAKLLAAPYLDFPKKETQLRPL
ncbi:MAG: hypothetical protein PHS64_04580, partial [Candidatus Omnitrophica bacterium]|nr:hypothetical protein [Candidatus Omnitrophota bacterium]